MNWIKVTLPPKNPKVAAWRHTSPYRTWCDHNLSSMGVLWKNDLTGEDWDVFYFAQPQDAMLFRIMCGAHDKYSL